METSRPGSRSTAVVTVLFCDLVASTERQSRLGEEVKPRRRPHGDLSGFRHGRRRVRDRFMYENNGLGVILSYGCSYDDHTRSTGKELSNASLAPYRGVDDGILVWACKAWTVPPVADAVFSDAASDDPTFIVSGALVPGFSLDWVDALRSGFTRATAMTMPTLSGGVLAHANPPCIGELRRRFQSDPTARLAVGPCEKQSPPIRFVPGI